MVDRPGRRGRPGPHEGPDDTTVGGLLGWIGEDVARYLARRVAAFLAFACAVIGLVGETPQVTSVAAVVVGAVGLVAVVGSAVTGLGRSRQWWVIGAVSITSLALVAVATAQRVRGPRSRLVTQSRHYAAAMHRWPMWAMIPLNLFLLVWVWLGRIVFGVGGWFILVLLPVVLVLGLLLLVTTILAFTQDGRPRSLTGLQHTGQLATWVGLLGFGAFLPDFGDAPDSYVSLLTNAFGYSDTLMQTSWVVTLAFAAVAVVGYVVLLGSLVAGRHRAGTDLVAA